MQDDAGTRGYYTKIRKSILYQSCTNFVLICKKYRRDLNQGEAYAPEEIRRKSVCMNEDIGEILKEL